MFDLFSVETVEFYRGQTVRLPCNTTHLNYVDWEYRTDSDGTKQPVYVNGAVDQNLRRYSVEYPLVIANAIASDEGYYECMENAGIGSTVAAYHLVYRGGSLLFHAVLTRVGISLKYLGAGCRNAWNFVQGLNLKPISTKKMTVYTHEVGGWSSWSESKLSEWGHIVSLL